MTLYVVTVQRIVTFEAILEIEAENDLLASDLAEAQADRKGFEWGPAKDDITQVEDIDEAEAGR